MIEPFQVLEVLPAAGAAFPNLYLNVAFADAVNANNTLAVKTSSNDAVADPVDMSVVLVEAAAVTIILLIVPVAVRV